MIKKGDTIKVIRDDLNGAGDICTKKGKIGEIRKMTSKQVLLKRYNKWIDIVNIKKIREVKAMKTKKVKQTKGLKDKLTARHKTMNQPDIMHDFGSLGKWSEGMLKINIYYGCSVPNIINTYTVNRISIESDIIKLQNKRYIFPTLKTISNGLSAIRKLEIKLNILIYNYKKYKLVIERLSKNIKE